MRRATAGGELDGARSDLIVYFSGSWFEGPPGHDRNMAAALGRYAPVLYVEPAISAMTRIRNQASDGPSSQAPLQVINPRLARLTTHVVPGMTRPVLYRIAEWQVGRATRAAVESLYGPAPAEAPEVRGVISSRVEPVWSILRAGRTLFYSTDDLPSGAEMLGIPRERLLRAEARALNGADAIAVVSPGLQQRYAQAGFAAEVVPNGCAPEAYAGVDCAPLPADVDLPGPVAGLVGIVNDRTDLELLEAVADAGCSLLIVGPLMPNFPAAQRFTALTERPNVCWVGPKPFSEVPSYLRLIDVGLTPYADNEFNRASFPLKTLEYLAAGRAVVATPLPANEWLDTNLIEIAAGPAEYAARVRDALTSARDPELAARRRDFARKHSWAVRAAAIATLLGVDSSTASAEGR